MTPLTEHFTLEEMCESQLAARLGIDNAPPPDAVERLRRLCEDVLEPARAALGPLRVSSGYRSPALNAATPGAVSTSQHMRGCAADVVPLQATRMDLARWVVANAPHDQVILEYGTEAEPAWVHVSHVERGDRRQVLRVLRDGRGYVPASL